MSALALQIVREFPARRSLAVRALDAVTGAGGAARRAGVHHVFLDAGGEAPAVGAMAALFADLLHALWPRPAFVVADRYLRLFGERAAETGHASVRKSGTAAFRTRGDAADLQWVLEEFVTEPPSIFFAEEMAQPSGARLQRLSLLLPKVHFLCEPALFNRHVSLYYHTAERGEALLAGVRAFCEGRGIALGDGAA